MEGIVNDTIVIGKELKVKDANLYPTYSSKKPSDIISGTYYAYCEQIVNERVRITDSLDSIHMHCAATGWIKLSDILVGEDE